MSAMSGVPAVASITAAPLRDKKASCFTEWEVLALSTAATTEYDA